jgi:hypothetical protein
MDQGKDENGLKRTPTAIEDSGIVEVTKGPQQVA